MPVRKIRKRYILFEISNDNRTALAKGALEDALGLTDTKPRGGKGVPERIVLLIYDPSTHRGIIRTPHTQLVKLREQLSEGIRVNNQSISIQILSVSGTIRKLKSKLLAHHSPTSAARSTPENSKA